MNPTYEWELNFNIEWSPVLYPDGWDEAKAAEHNSRPPAEFERISLDPPSGRFYSREEGVRQSFEPGGRFGPEREDEREDEEVEAPQESPKPASASGGGPAEPELEPETNPNKLWIVLLVLGLLLAVVVVLMRKR